MSPAGENGGRDFLTAAALERLLTPTLVWLQREFFLWRDDEGLVIEIVIFVLVVSSPRDIVTSAELVLVSVPDLFKNIIKYYYRL